jgi:hypothetical protein
MTRIIRGEPEAKRRKAMTRLSVADKEKTLSEHRAALVAAGYVGVELLQLFPADTKIGKHSRSFVRNMTKAIRAWERMEGAASAIYRRHQDRQAHQK